MTIEFTPALKAYLEGRKKQIISVEIASSDHSDFDVTEIFLRLVSEDFADYLIKKKNYRARTTEDGGTVLLPAYRLEYDDKVVFDLRTRWIFKHITYTGIRL